MKVRKGIVIMVLAVVLMSVAACSLRTDTALATQTAVVKGDLIIKVTGTGKTAYAVDAKLAFDTAGKIEVLAVKEGDRVTKGSILAKLDTASLELSLTQAKVGVAQAQKAVTTAEVAVTQSQISLSQAKSAQIQAESAVIAAQFNLDQIQAVGDIKDKIMDVEIAISSAREYRRIATITGDNASLASLTQHLTDLNNELNAYNTDLQKLLAKDEYSGVAPYEIMTYDLVAGTYALGGQTYNRLVVEDIQIKQKELENAQAGVTEAAQNIEQANQNIQLADQTLEQARLSLEEADKAVEVAQKQLAHATIIAPFDGVAASVDIKQGDYIVTPGLSTGTPIYLVDPDSLEISTEIDEIDMANVQVSQPAVINLDALPGLVFTGTVTSISMVPKVDTQKSGIVVYEVKAGFNSSPSLQVKSGMSASADIITREKKDVLLIPNKSIITNAGGETVVNLVKDKKVEQRQVTLGLTDGLQTEVISGLQAGDIITR